MKCGCLSCCVTLNTMLRICFPRNSTIQRVICHFSYTLTSLASANRCSQGTYRCLSGGVLPMVITCDALQSEGGESRTAAIDGQHHHDDASVLVLQNEGRWYTTQVTTTWLLGNFSLVGPIVSVKRTMVHIRTAGSVKTCRACQPPSACGELDIPQPTSRRPAQHLAQWGGSDVQP